MHSYNSFKIWIRHLLRTQMYSNTTRFSMSPSSAPSMYKFVCKNERLHGYRMMGVGGWRGGESIWRIRNTRATVTVNHVHVDGSWLSKCGHARIVSGVCKLGPGYVQRALESVHPFGVNAHPRLSDWLQACLVRVHGHVTQVPEYGSQVVWALAQLTPHVHLAVFLDVQLRRSANPGPHLCESNARIQSITVVMSITEY